MILTDTEDIDLIKFITMLSYQNLDCDNLDFIYYYYTLILKYLTFIIRDDYINLEELYYTLLIDSENKMS